jgi:hypothetical protein
MLPLTTLTLEAYKIIRHYGKATLRKGKSLVRDRGEVQVYGIRIRQSRLH